MVSKRVRYWQQMKARKYQTNKKHRRQPVLSGRCNMPNTHNNPNQVDCTACYRENQAVNVVC